MVKSETTEGRRFGDISFVLLGTPVPKGRPKAHNVHGHVAMYTPAKTRAYEARVGKAASDAMRGREIMPCSVQVRLLFHLKRPKSLSKRVTTHVKRPDVDNLAKAVLDGMEGHVYVNDSQIFDLHVTKEYGEPEGVLIEVHAMTIGDMVFQYAKVVWKNFHAWIRPQGSLLDGTSR